MKRTYRIVVAKPGLDGHDRGAKTITRALRDHGFEVIYTGLHQTPEQIAETVLQEDADGVGLSLLAGAHLTLFPRVMDELRRFTAEHPIMLFVKFKKGTFLLLSCFSTSVGATLLNENIVGWLQFQKQR